MQETKMLILRMDDCSMEPRIPEFGKMVIDKADKEIRHGKVYLFTLGNKAMVRRFYKVSGGLNLCPDNRETYDPVFIPDAQIGDLSVCGRITEIRVDLD